MTAQEQFLVWLERHDPFVYDYVIAKLEGEQLASWGAVFSSIGQAVSSLGPAYANYKSSRDSQKLEKARIDLEREALRRNTPAAPPPIKQIVTPPPTAPPENTAALTEILERFKLAMQNKAQPPTQNYTPFVPATGNTRAQAQAVALSQSWYSQLPKEVLYGGGLLLLLLIKRSRD